LEAKQQFKLLAEIGLRGRAAAETKYSPITILERFDPLFDRGGGTSAGWKL
jgi:hypothetical protein